MSARASIIAAVLTLAVSIPPALAANKVQAVTSAAGITAWLVEDHSLPVITIDVSFRGGASLDPAGKAGLATFTADLLDEGAGDLDSPTFQGKLEDLAASVEFSASEDALTASLRTITASLVPALDLLRLSLTAPRFDEPAVTRVRGQLLAQLARDQREPHYIASRLWFRNALGDHPYARPLRGTAETIERIAIDDMRSLVHDRFGKDVMLIGVVGDITPTVLHDLLDKTFGALPAHAATASVPEVEANAAGQSDRINVGGTAAIGGGATVQVLAQPGNYGRSTTYTILRANGGVSGTYAGVSDNFAFLTPSLSYDANDVFLTLTLNSFEFGGRTYNQRQVGRTLDQTFNSASGDYATVQNAIMGLGTANGPITLDMISGQQYAGFSNAMVQGAQLFLTNFANRAGSSSGGGTKIALAEACDVACDATTPAVWGVWGGAVGGTGTIAGNDNAGTFTYSVGGFSGGLDRKFGDSFLAGVTVGYQTGGQWTGAFDGRSVTDAIQAGLYGSFLQGPLYVDAIAAYGYSSNQLWRNINIPGLQPRTAYGNGGANQFLGQLETGWRFDLGGTPNYFVTPFGLIQGSVSAQNAFTETGAQSLNLGVAQQTTSSLRTIFGAQLGAALDVGLRDKIAAQLRFGWSHEYSDTARPVTASFVGAPAVPFTVFGAAPTRDGAVIGFSASTAIAEAMGVYVRYEGTIAGQDSSHALTAGLRMTW